MSETVKNLNEMMSKLKDVGELFKFGEKMIPVVENFISFMSDFIPIIEEVNGSIEETRSKIPEASQQINNVTSATELAITEVLDVVDEINEQINSIDECLSDMIASRLTVEELVKNLQHEIKDNEKAKKLLKEITDKIDVSLDLEMMKNKLKGIITNTDQITMSLQVQDITAQQLAAVNHLIISVQHKLSNLLAVFNLKDDDTFSADNLELPGTHFDANASYNKSTNDQDLVDSVISGEKASQDDIDKLFS